MPMPHRPPPIDGGTLRARPYRRDGMSVAALSRCVIRLDVATSGHSSPASLTQPYQSSPAMRSVRKWYKCGINPNIKALLAPL